MIKIIQFEINEHFDSNGFGLSLVKSNWERELGGGISQLETNVHSVSNGFGQGRVISSWEAWEVGTIESNESFVSNGFGQNLVTTNSNGFGWSLQQSLISREVSVISNWTIVSATVRVTICLFSAWVYSKPTIQQSNFCDGSRCLVDSGNYRVWGWTEHVNIYYLRCRFGTVYVTV